MSKSLQALGHALPYSGMRKARGSTANAYVSLDVLSNKSISGPGF